MPSFDETIRARVNERMAMEAHTASQTKAEVVSLTREVPVILSSCSRVLDILVDPRGVIFTKESQGKSESLTRGKHMARFESKWAMPRNRLPNHSREEGSPKSK